MFMMSHSQYVIDPDSLSIQKARTHVKMTLSGDGEMSCSWVMGCIIGPMGSITSQSLTGPIAAALTQIPVMSTRRLFPLRRPERLKSHIFHATGQFSAAEIRAWYNIGYS